MKIAITDTEKGLNIKSMFVVKCEEHNLNLSHQHQGVTKSNMRLSELTLPLRGLWNEH